MQDNQIIRLVRKRKQIIVLDKNNDRAYLIQVLDNKLGNRFWRAL